MRRPRSSQNSTRRSLNHPFQVGFQAEGGATDRVLLCDTTPALGFSAALSAVNLLVAYHGLGFETPPAPPSAPTQTQPSDEPPERVVR